MQWFLDLWIKESLAQTLVMLCVAVFPGIWLGNRSVAGIKIGIAGVLFSGLGVGAFGFPLDTHVLHFVREFGLILFVFAIGLQVGPGFFSNFRNQGMALNAYALAIVCLGVGVAVVELKILKIPVEVMVGVLSGAVTNTPGLGAAQQALKDVPTLGEAASALSGTGYAVAYPFGILGIIITMLLVRWFFRVRIESEAELFDENRQQSHGVQTFTVQLRNPLLQGKSLETVLKLINTSVVVSRLSREGVIRIPEDSVELQLEDLLHVVCAKSDLEKVTSVVGLPVEQDLRTQSSDIAVKHVLVSNSICVGQRLTQMRFPERLGVRMTRIVRGDQEFVPDPFLELNMGDRLTVVGHPDSLKACAQELGDAHQVLEHPNLLPIFLGILCGVLLGSIPIAIPGLPAPVKLGMAGGPLVVALLMGYKRRIGSLSFHISGGASLFMKELGILLFLAAVGLTSGSHLLYALQSGEGWYWMGAGVAITLLPLLIVGFVARLRGLNYLTLSGLLAGSMTDPPALGYANSLSTSNAQAVAYATVYPFTMFLRVMTAQVFVMLMA